MRSDTTTLQPLADKAAIGLSLLCAVHCLGLPLMAALLPSALALGFADESFHTWLVIFVIPLSAFALTLGCRKHRHMSVVCTGMFGLVCLCAAALLGHDLLGELGERGFTLLGAVLIALSHLKNYQLCSRVDPCECPEQ